MPAARRRFHSTDRVGIAVHEVAAGGSVFGVPPHATPLQTNQQTNSALCRNVVNPTIGGNLIPI